MNNVDHHQQKYCHPIKVKEAPVAAAAAATTANSKAGRRRRLLLTREASNLSNSSIEAEYHAQEPAAVPFVWESCPGTPKRHVIMRSSCHEIDHEILLPPLTPPPSYYHQGNVTLIRPRCSSSSKKKKQNDASNVNLIQTIFPRLSFKKDQPPALSTSSSTKSSSPTSTLTSLSSSSSSSSSSSPSSQPRSVVSTPSPKHRHRLSFQYSTPEVEEDEEVGSSGSPVSTLCFRRLSCCNRRFRGLYSSWF